MSFIWPAMLLLLVVVPLLVAFYILLQQRRRRITARYGNLGLVQGSTGRTPGIRRHIPPALFLAGLTILLIALARPQSVFSLPKTEGTVILAFDVSGSMAADDLEPTRMDAAKAAARDFVARQPLSVQIGVVAFSESGFTVQPPTDDQEAILATIDRLVPERGTSLASGIIGSLNTIAAGSGQLPQQENSAAPVPTPTPVPYGTYTSAIIVLLTDGENTAPPDPFEAAQAAADRGVRIYTVGIGSAAGTTLTVNGFTVHTQLDEATLKQIAEMTDGAYYNAENEEVLQAIYENLDRQLVIKPEKMEVTSVFAGASMIIFLIGGAFSFLWFSRMP